MRRGRYFVHRYFRNGSDLESMPELEFSTEAEAMDAGEKAAAFFAGVSVCSMSGSIETVLNISGLASYGDVPEIVF